MAKNRFVALITAITGFAIIYFLYRFNYTAASYNYYLVGNMIALFFLPILIIFFVIREEPDKFGLRRVDSSVIWILLPILYIGVTVLMLFVFKSAAFQDYYPLFKGYPEFSRAFSNYPNENPLSAEPMLMAYAWLSYGMYLFFWEFFFRGYLLFGLARSINWWAVIVQAAAFGLLHAGKPILEIIASFGAGIILGIIALNVKSFIPCFVLHWAASITLDLLVIAGRPK